LKPLPPVIKKRHADFPDQEDDDATSEEDDWGEQADEVNYRPLRRRNVRSERPEILATAEQASQFWSAESARLSDLHLDTDRFAQPVSTEQQQRSVALFRKLVSLPAQLRRACCVCAQLHPHDQISTFRLPGATPDPNYV